MNCPLCNQPTIYYIGLIKGGYNRHFIICRNRACLTFKWNIQGMAKKREKAEADFLAQIEQHQPKPVDAKPASA